MSEIKILPVLPLRDIVVFPHMVVPLFVGREKSVRALEEVMRGEQADPAGHPEEHGRRRSVARRHLSTSACVATVLQLLKLPDGTVKVLVEGKRARAGIARFTDQDRVLRGRDRRRSHEDGAGSPEAEALIARGGRAVRELCEAEQEGPARGAGSIPQIDRARPSWPTASPRHLSVKIADKQQLLEIFNVVKRLEKVYALMEGEISRPAGREEDPQRA